MPRYSYQREAVLSYAEVQGMIDGTDSLPTKALIAFLYIFGCRISEALKVKKEDVRVLKSRFVVRLFILKRKEKGPTLPTHPVTASLKAPFAGYFLDWEGRVSEGKIWLISRTTAWRWIKRLNPQCSPHLFRHTRATNLAEVTNNPYALVDWFGWATPSMAMKYIHLTGREAAKLANKIR